MYIATYLAKYMCKLNVHVQPIQCLKLYIVSCIHLATKALLYTLLHVRTSEHTTSIN